MFRSTLILALSVAAFVLGSPVQALAQPEGAAARPPPPPRFALIVGVDTYSPEGYTLVPGSKTVRLRNLNTPCKDAERLAAGLEKLGWRGELDPNPEIKVSCNESAGELRGAVGELTDFLTQNEHAFGLLYFAGHGVEINQRNYLFAKLAEVNLAGAVRSLTSDGGRPLFRGSALEVSEDIVGALGEACDCDLLVILDACRDDPLAYEAIATQTQSRISAPQIDGIPKGMMVYYATTPGRRVEETTSSYLADALADEFEAEARKPTKSTILAALVKVRDVVEGKTRSSRYKQIPQPHGLLNRLSLCFAECSTDTAEAPLIWRAAADPRRDRQFQLARYVDGQAPPGAAARVTERAAIVSKAKPLSVTVFDKRAATERQAVATPLRGITLDVFWCDGTPGAEERQAMAQEVARAAEGLQITRDGTASVVDRIRVRAFAPDVNSQPGFRVSDNIIRIDSGSGQEEELATGLRGRMSKSLGIQRVRGQTLDYLSVFVCKGVAAFSQPPRVWLHVAREDQRAFASVLGQAVMRERPDVNVAARIQVVKTSPGETQIRYFFPEDVGTAGAVADIISTSLRARPSIKYLAGYEATAPRGLVEIWVGGAETNLDRRLDAAALTLK